MPLVALYVDANGNPVWGNTDNPNAGTWTGSLWTGGTSVISDPITNLAQTVPAGGSSGWLQPYIKPLETGAGAATASLGIVDKILGAGAGAMFPGLSPAIAAVSQAAANATPGTSITGSILGSLGSNLLGGLGNFAIPIILWILTRKSRNKLVKALPFIAIGADLLYPGGIIGLAKGAIGTITGNGSGINTPLTGTSVVAGALGSMLGIGGGLGSLITGGVGALLGNKLASGLKGKRRSYRRYSRPRTRYYTYRRRSSNYRIY